MDYQFQKIDQTVLDATREEWTRQIESNEGDLVPGHYYRILDWSESHLEGRGAQNTYIYCLTRAKAPLVACAILEISHARPKSNDPWLKVLSIHVEPDLDTGDGEINLGELAKITSRSIIESLGLTFAQHPSSQLKVYASGSLTVKFIEGVSSVTLDSQDKLKISTHGNWLVVDKL